MQIQKCIIQDFVLRTHKSQTQKNIHQYTHTHIHSRRSWEQYSKYGEGVKLHFCIYIHKRSK